MTKIVEWKQRSFGKANHSYLMAKVFTIPVAPRSRPAKPRSSDPRYLEGQRLIVEAMRHLAQDAANNREAIELLSEHFRTRFRMSDRPPLPRA